MTFPKLLLLASAFLFSCQSTRYVNAPIEKKVIIEHEVLRIDTVKSTSIVKEYEIVNSVNVMHVTAILDTVIRGDSLFIKYASKIDEWALRYVKIPTEIIVRDTLNLEAVEVVVENWKSKNYYVSVVISFILGGIVILSIFIRRL